ncbi:MAG: hypothetical protein K5655_01635 [Lachnospiraceae bacterium]|nr:hypothetical protein [Lachnospiraceae bacterium]
MEDIENIENVEISVKAEEITDETDPMEILDRFLDARMAKKKMEILSENADRIDEKMIGNIEASLDLPGGNGSLSDRIDYVLYCLRTKSRFETDRLR